MTDVNEQRKKHWTDEIVSADQPSRFPLIDWKTQSRESGPYDGASRDQLRDLLFDVWKTPSVGASELFGSIPWEPLSLSWRSNTRRPFGEWLNALRARRLENIMKRETLPMSTRLAFEVTL